MGSLRDLSSGRVVFLEPEHTVGRSPLASLRIDERYVSSQHSHIRWTGDAWHVKDLGSRNGTFVDRARLSPGKDHPLRMAAEVAFGRREQAWLFADASAPTTMMIPVDGSVPLLVENELLAIPSIDAPLATAYRDTGGSWMLERPDSVSVYLLHQQLVTVGDKVYRFCCTSLSNRTSLAEELAEQEVSQLLLKFSVSSDEEHVELLVAHGGRDVPFGARGHNYLLLTLARARLRDALAGLEDAQCGWLYQDELAHDPTMAPPQLNIDIFRLRGQFAQLGVSDPARIVERRTSTRQLRIGTGKLLISRV